MGLTPDQVLDMQLWQFNAYVRGYELRRKYAHADAIYTGYYAGHFNPFNKRKSKVSVLLRRLFGTESSEVKPDVDVALFKKREAAFNERKRQYESGRN